MSSSSQPLLYSSFFRMYKHMTSSRIVAVSYLAAALTAPYVLPLKSTLYTKYDTPTHGVFSIGKTFRI